MFEVSVEDTFASGHYLRGYRGKCEKPHGHNYKIRITLAGDSLDNIGLLYDFRDLKQVMNDIIDRIDHQMLNDVEPFNTVNPSAENMAKYFYDELNTRIARDSDRRVRVIRVKLWETDTTTAMYYE